MFRKIVEKSAVKTDIQLEKRAQIGLCRKISNLYKVSSIFNVCLKNKLTIISSIAKKKYALLLSRNNPSETGKIILQ